MAEGQKRLSVLRSISARVVRAETAMGVSIGADARNRDEAVRRNRLGVLYYEPQNER